MVTVSAGIVVEEVVVTRNWLFTQEDLDKPPTYIDQVGAAMNYAMSLQNPKQYNWVTFEWTWF
jgi:hypothetical protein